MEEPSSAQSKSQKRNAKKRAKQQEKKEAAEVADGCEDAQVVILLEPLYRAIYENSRHIIGERLVEHGESPLTEVEWDALWAYVPTAVHSLHRAVQKMREGDTASPNPIIDYEIQWKTVGDVASPEKQTTGEENCGPQATAQARGDPGSPKMARTGAAAKAARSTSARKREQGTPSMSPGGHHDSPSDIYAALWTKAVALANKKIATTDVSNSQQHEITVSIFRNLKKQYKSRQKQRLKDHSRVQQ